MNTNTALGEAQTPARVDAAGTWTSYLVPLGLAAFATAFVWFAPGNFSQEASRGLPNKVRH